MFFQPIGRKVGFDASNETREKQMSNFYIIQNVEINASVVTISYIIFRLESNRINILKLSRPHIIHRIRMMPEASKRVAGG